MDEDDRRLAELTAFLRKALEIELEARDVPLTEEELKEIALRSGLNESDWERLCERIKGHLDKGRNFLKYENYGDAIEELDQAVVLAPYRVDVLHDCGVAHLHHWEQSRSSPSRERAEELFRRCLEIDPGHKGAAERVSRLRMDPPKTGTRKKLISAVAALVLLSGGIVFWRNAPDSPGDTAKSLTNDSAVTSVSIPNFAPRIHRAGNLVAMARLKETGSAFPVEIPDDIVQLAVGFGDTGHILALRADGTLLAWGDDEFGQARPPELRGIVQVAAGYRHGLSLRGDGTVAAWGDNSDGQCNVPSGLDNVIQVSAGTRHSVALRADGSVVAWGANEKGQSEVPPDLGPVAKLADFNADHTVVILRDGKLAAWGVNSEGQCDVPNQAVGSASVVRILAGGENYALLDDGRVLHWGRPLRTGSFPPQINDIRNIFSGFPGAIIVKKVDGKFEMHGAVRNRPGLNQELNKWESIVVGPDYIFGIIPSGNPDLPSRNRRDLKMLTDG